MNLAGSAMTSSGYYITAATTLFLSFLAFAISVRGVNPRGSYRLASLLFAPFFFGGHIYLLFWSPPVGSSFAVSVHQLSLSVWFVAYASVAFAAVALTLGAYDWFKEKRRRDALVEVGFAFMVFFLVLGIGRSWVPEFLAMLVIALTAVLIHYQLVESERASDRIPDITTY